LFLVCLNFTVSRFIRPGMQRIATKEKTPSLNGVLEMVFVSKVYDGSSTAILINTTGNWVQVQFTWLPNEVPGKARKVYYSTLVETFTYAGIFPQSAKIYLKPVRIARPDGGLLYTRLLDMVRFGSNVANTILFHFRMLQESITTLHSGDY
jgi:hypothetical protein